MPGSVTLENGRYVLEFAWDAELIAAVRKVPGRRIEGRNVWSIPQQYGATVRAIATTHGLGMADFPDSPAIPAVIDRNANGFEVRFDYSDQALVLAVAAIPGSAWFSPSACWMVPDAQGIAVNLFAEQASAQVSSAAEDIIAYAYEAGDRFIKSAAKTSDFSLARPGFGLELYPEQRAGVEYVLAAKGRCIIADEPGVGKTAQALAVIHEYHSFPAVIIVPASLKVNWRREALRAMPYATVEIVRGTRPQPRLLWADIVIINYDILEYWIGNLPHPLAVVADESHWIKNPAIARTKATIALMNEVPNTPATARLCLTGTPVPNRTNEIMTQLEAVGTIRKFGGIHTARKYWKGKGAELNRRLRETCYVRRLKKDVWPADSPERDWADLYLEPDEKAMIEYRAAEKDIVAYLGEKARKAAIASGATDQAGMRAAWEAAMRASAAEHLVAITHLKQLAARAAMPAVKAWAKEFLSTGEKLTMFGWHRAVVDELTTSFNAVKVQGGMSETERQRSVDYFQEKPEIKVFVGQIKAAGEGLTLTAASTCLLVEQAWNQATHDQVLDRMHRRGQEHDCIGYVVLVEDTITVDIQALIRRKQKEIVAVVDGQEAGEQTSVLSDLVVLLAERGMK